MNTVSFLSRLALTGIAAFAISLVFDVQPLALFSFATGALTLLVAAGDYAPRDRDWATSRGQVLEFKPATNDVPATEKVAA